MDAEQHRGIPRALVHKVQESVFDLEEARTVGPEVCDRRAEILCHQEGVLFQGAWAQATHKAAGFSDGLDGHGKISRGRITGRDRARWEKLACLAGLAAAVADFSP